MTGASLKDFRRTLRFSQPELARVLDISFATVTRWERRGAKQIPNPLLERALRDVYEEYNPWIKLLGHEVMLEPLSNDLARYEDPAFHLTKVTAAI
ncbi:MAG: hypothetical protein ABIP75_12560 [Pyrinomonadaceae bacterium]